MRPLRRESKRRQTGARRRTARVQSGYSAGTATCLLASDGAVGRSRGIKVPRGALESRQSAAWELGGYGSRRIHRPDTRAAMLSGGRVAGMVGGLSQRGQHEPEAVHGRQPVALTTMPHGLRQRQHWHRREVSKVPLSPSRLPTGLPPVCPMGSLVEKSIHLWQPHPI